MNVDDAKFLEDMSGRYAEPYALAVNDLLAALVVGNAPAAADARARLGEVVTETMAFGEVIGAASALRAAAEHPEPVAFARPLQKLVPRVTLKVALEDLVDRAPVTMRRAADRTARAIAKLYERGAVMAFARSAEATVTKEAQAFIARAFRLGMTENEAGRKLAKSINEVRKRSREWSDGYARMVFRTNVNTAVTAGRFRMTHDPDVKAVVPAFRLSTAGDVDVRSNHRPADGMILRVDNPAWAKLAPPLGYSCRCRVDHVTRVELEMLGRIDKRGNVRESKIPAGAFPDPGFRHAGRPDLLINRGGR